MPATEIRPAPPPPDPGPGIAADPGQWQSGWVRVAIALVAAGQGMAFGLAANLSQPESAGAYWLLHGGLLASALLVFALLGGPLARESVAAVRAGRITIDLLFLISLSGAFGVSVFSTVRGEGPVFYELVAILLSIYTVGRLLGARSRARALQAVEELRREYERCLVLDAHGGTEERRADAVHPGERVLVGAGAAASVDGIIREGRGLVATTPLTGEPEPVPLGPGDRLAAGMHSIDGTFVVEVTAAGGARQLDAMLGIIAQARLAPSRLQQSADRLAARFVPLVLLVSAGTFAGWWYGADFVTAVHHGLAVLVVACPCALGLATPLGIWAGLVQLGRLGIVARTGDFLDALATADRAIFDKTGTLYESGMQVKQLVVFSSSPLPTPELCGVLAAAEHGIDHPVAQALRAVAPPNRDGAARWSLIEARVVPGRGLRARVRDAADGWEHEVLAGTRQLLAEAGVALLAEVASAAGADGVRRIQVAIDGVATACVEIEERARPQVAATFAALAARGLQVEVLTGDRDFSGRWPGVTCRTGLAPEEKVAHVRAAAARGDRVLFVGDGLNDAPALAVAHASIAIRQGADLARSAAQAVTGGEDLGTLPAAIQLARDVLRAIRANLRFAVAYNTVAMALAAAGWVHPVLAALLMAGSSAIVSARVLRVTAKPAGMEPR